MALAILAVLLYPVVWTIGASFKPTADIVGTLELFSPTPTGDNYARALEGVAGASIWSFFRNSVVLAGWR